MSKKSKLTKPMRRVLRIFDCGLHGRLMHWPNAGRWWFANTPPDVSHMTAISLLGRGFIRILKSESDRFLECYKETAAGRKALKEGE